MSETEHNIGKLIPVPLVGDIENTAKTILESLGVGPEEGHTTFVSQLQEEMYKKYIIHDGKIYKTEYIEVNDYDDLFNASINEDGSINFETKYYNGGCDFNEAIGYALKKIKINYRC